MKNLWSILRTLLIVLSLTVLTQVGGLIYLLYLPLRHYWNQRIKHRWKARLYRWTIFAMLYVLICTLLIPPLARLGGRRPLPWLASIAEPIQPASWFFTLANRHYVDQPLYELTIEAAQTMTRASKYASLTYLDANFPFFAGFPLLPHLSHDDGRKLDLAFLYHYTDGTPLLDAPSTFGYGYYEKPAQGEVNQPEICKQRGHWQYSLTRWLTPFSTRSDLVFDAAANRELLRILAKSPKTGKIFIEPHLKKRLDLDNEAKIRFHGCQAVRHDDHIHTQY